MKRQFKSSFFNSSSRHSNSGIKAQAAQSLVGLGVDFTNMRTHRTLAEALASLIGEHEIKRNGISQNGTGKDFR
jgi:hypothetical protein